MRLNRNISFPALLTLSAITIPACSTSSAPQTIVDLHAIPLSEAAPDLAALFGPSISLQASSSPTLLTLGAGDALGRALYISDILLAARLRQSENEFSTFVDAPIPSDDTP